MKGSVPLWVGRALHFFGNSLQDAISDSIATASGAEFCVVQYCQILSREELSVDGVYECLRSFRLIGNRSLGNARKFSATEEYSLIPCDGIHGRFQVVSADIGAALKAKEV